MFESVEGIFFYSFFKYVGRLCNYKFTDMLPLYFLPAENDLDEPNPQKKMVQIPCLLGRRLSGYHNFKHKGLMSFYLVMLFSSIYIIIGKGHWSIYTMKKGSQIIIVLWILVSGLHMLVFVSDLNLDSKLWGAFFFVLRVRSFFLMQCHTGGSLPPPPGRILLCCNIC